METEILWYDQLATPIGDLLLVANAEGLLHVGFEQERHPWQNLGPRQFAPDRLLDVSRQLREYFAGDRQQFELALVARGTAFQCRVWAGLRAIPYAGSISYGELARRIEQPKAVRAVGLANGRNPLPIIVPCHRVIGADGSLTGFGGGLDRKRWLLAHEASHH